MVLAPKDITLKNFFNVDGNKNIQASNELNYFGFLAQSFDITIYGGEIDISIPLTFKGVIRKIIILNRSCGEVYYKLNGSAERYIINTQAILSQQPTSLLIDNDDADINKVLRIKVIGEEN
tara:strand:+ start:12293 stop:12655 length:363 start_codon:yes stop_codon:yes gene_type:complete